LSSKVVILFCERFILFCDTRFLTTSSKCRLERFYGTNTRTYVPRFFTATQKYYGYVERRRKVPERDFSHLI